MIEIIKGTTTPLSDMGLLQVLVGMHLLTILQRIFVGQWIVSNLGTEELKNIQM